MIKDQYESEWIDSKLFNEMDQFIEGCNDDNLSPISDSVIDDIIVLLDEVDEVSIGGGVVFCGVLECTEDFNEVYKQVLDDMGVQYTESEQDAFSKLNTGE